jgi:hypothetical protein
LPNGDIEVKCFDESVTARSVLDKVMAVHPEFAGDLDLEIDGTRLAGDDLVRSDRVCVMQEGSRTYRFQFEGSRDHFVRRVSVSMSIRAVIKEIRDDDPHDMILSLDDPLPMEEIFIHVVPRDRVTMIQRLPLSYDISNGDRRFTIELNDDATVDTLKVVIQSLINVALDRISLRVGDEEVSGNPLLIDRYSKMRRISVNVLDPNYEFVEESGESHFFRFSEDVSIRLVFEFLTKQFHCHVGLSDSCSKLSRRSNERFFGRGVYYYRLRLRGFKFQFLLSGHSRITKVRLPKPTIMSLRLLLRRSPKDPCTLMIVSEEKELFEQRLSPDEIVIRCSNRVLRDSEAFPARICESDRVVGVELVSRDVTFVLEGQEKRLRLGLDKRIDKVENAISGEFGFPIKLDTFHSSDLTVRECFRDNSRISVQKCIPAIPIFSGLVKTLVIWKKLDR